MILSIQHVQISIAPGTLESSRRFYVDLLGGEPMIDQFPRPDGFWVRAGNAEIHIRTETSVDRTKTHAHPAFLVDDLTKLRDALLAGGFDVIEQPTIPGSDRFHTHDPSGNRVELMQRV